MSDVKITAYEGGPGNLAGMYVNGKHLDPTEVAALRYYFATEQPPHNVLPNYSAKRAWCDDHWCAHWFEDECSDECPGPKKKNGEQDGLQE